MQPEESAAAMRKLLDHLGWNQTALGKELGVSRNLVSMMTREENPTPASKPVSLLLRALMARHPEVFGGRLPDDGQVEAAPHGQASPRLQESHHTSGGRGALRRAREAKGLTVAELAKQAGYSIATYQDIEEGRSGMSEKMGKKVARLLGIDVSILMDGADEPPARNGPYGTVGAEPELEMGPGMEGIKARYVPLLSWAECGRMMAYDDTAYTHDGFVAFAPEDRKAFAVRLTGDSMAPVYGPGDVAIVYPSFRPQNNDLVIARLDEESGGDVMFKIYQSSGDMVKLSSINPSYPPMDFKKEQFAWIYPVDSVNKKTRRSAL